MTGTAIGGSGDGRGIISEHNGNYIIIYSPLILWMWTNVFNRPGVAGVVLHTDSYFIMKVFELKSV